MKYIVVTNTINRNKDLVERSLLASLNQPIKPAFVVLIDQNEFPLVLDKLITTNPVFIHESVNVKSVSSARNSLKIPQGIEWIIFCDDDGYMAKDYSKILEEKLRSNPGIEILAGKIIREDTNTHYTIRHKNFNSLKKFRHTKNLMGSNFVIRSDVYDRLGRFNENFGAGSYWGSSEETDLCWKAFFSGRKMEFFPELIVYHVPPFQESIKKGFKKAFNYGVGKGALVWKWLFIERKAKVLYEFGEMIVVPLLLMVRGLFILKPQLIPNSIATISGRMYGFIKAFFVRKF